MPLYVRGQPYPRGRPGSRRHHGPPAAGGGGGGPASSLLTGLVAYWHAYSGGNWADASGGGHTLTAGGGPGPIGQAPGQLSTAAHFGASTTHILYSDDAALLLTGSFTLGGWWRTEDLSQVDGGLAMTLATDSNLPIELYAAAASSNRMKLFVTPDGSAYTGVTADTYGNLAAGVEHLVLGWYDADAGTLGVSVNNVADTVAYADGIWASGARFKFMADNYPLGPANMESRLDGWGLWARTLTSDERAALWNSGAGDETWLP